MPEGLASFFIIACSPPGGVVVDPFAGSGTTSVIARRHGRQAGGIDLHEDHVTIAHQRIANDVVDADPGELLLA
jgi:DNA modification methylase